MTTPPVSFDEVRRDQLTVVGDDVYDLGRFAAKHPGGREVSHLRGTDATLSLVNAHGVQGELPRLPKTMRVGEIDAATLDATDRDLRALWQSFRARGLFRYRRRWLAVDVLRGLGLFAVAWLTKGTPWLSFALFTVALLNVMWWVHDVCHDSVFSDRQQAKRWAETASILFVGTPVLDYQYVVHRVHHGYTNVIGADQALDTGPVIWDERMRARTLEGFVALQAWAWFFLILPLTFPLFLATAIYDRVKARDAGTLAIVAARWAVVVFVFRADPWLLAGPVLCAGYALAFISSLNHFHKPLSTSFDPNFARSVTHVTQNLRHRGPLATWLTGGLNFHIEHHLFATMPRHNYRVIAPEVRAFCARHGLPYATCSFAEAVSALWGALRRPAAAPARLAVPPAS